MTDKSVPLPSWFFNAIQALQRGDVAGWMNLYATDAVHEFPFAPQNAIRSLEGKEAIYAYMSQLPELIRFGELKEVRVLHCGDEVVIEATGHHQRVSNGTPIEINYVWILTQKEEKVIHFRDYMNPLQLASL